MYCEWVHLCKRDHRLLAYVLSCFLIIFDYVLLLIQALFELVFPKVRNICSGILCIDRSKLNAALISLFSFTNDFRGTFLVNFMLCLIRGCS